MHNRYDYDGESWCVIIFLKNIPIKNQIDFILTNEINFK